jgi:hypothetical protein
MVEGSKASLSLYHSITPTGFEDVSITLSLPEGSETSLSLLFQ